MENILRTLFDFQRFENHIDLSNVIVSTHSRCMRQQLDLDDMEYVAAGVMIDHKSNEDRK